MSNGYYEMMNVNTNEGKAVSKNDFDSLLLNNKKVLISGLSGDEIGRYNQDPNFSYIFCSQNTNKQIVFDNNWALLINSTF